MAQYDAKCNELAKYAPQLVATEIDRAEKFEEGLRPYILNRIAPLQIRNYAKIVDRAMTIEGTTEQISQLRGMRSSQGGQSQFTQQAQAPPAKRPRFEASAQRANLNPQLATVTCEKYEKRHLTKRCNWVQGSCFRCGQKGIK